MAVIYLTKTDGGTLPTPEAGQSVLYVDSTSDNLALKGQTGDPVIVGSGAGAGAGLPDGLTAGNTLVFNGTDWEQIHIQQNGEQYFDNNHLYNSVKTLNEAFETVSPMPTPEFRLLKNKIFINSNFEIDTTFQDVFYDADLVAWKANIDTITGATSAPGVYITEWYDKFPEFEKGLVNLLDNIVDQFKTIEDAKVNSMVNLESAGFTGGDAIYDNLEAYYDEAIDYLNSVASIIDTFKTDWSNFRTTLTPPPA
jgi:hypothetical protein